MNRAEELRLLGRAQRGDRDAFAALYRANVQAIFRYIVHRVGDAALAEDFTADVFVRALKSLATYEDQGKPLVAWLYRIAHARVVDHYRRVGRRPAEDDLDEGSEVAIQPDMDQSLFRRQMAQMLRQAITGLTDEQQQVVVLRFVEGCSLEEAAQVMGKNANAIKALQHRALRSLAGRLERAGLDIDDILSGLS
ncbi:MAG: sigma-70 family RNA polymerase sigma factor [Anaerolineae bacterium]|nr:sigma-70 family RNA polymerase sigma factor [Anaerolineae bacterium]